MLINIYHHEETKHKTLVIFKGRLCKSLMYIPTYVYKLACTYVHNLCTYIRTYMGKTKVCTQQKVNIQRQMAVPIH